MLCVSGGYLDLVDGDLSLPHLDVLPQVVLQVLEDHHQPLAEVHHVDQSAQPCLLHDVLVLQLLQQRDLADRC